MKILTSLKALLLAGVVGFMPLPAGAAPKEKEESSDSAKRKVQQAQQRQVARPAPQRAPQQRQTVTRSAPQPSVQRAQPRPQASSEARNRAMAQQANAQRAQAARVQSQQAQQAQAQRAQAQRAQSQQAQAQRAQMQRAQAERAQAQRSQVQRSEPKRAEAQVERAQAAQRASAQREAAQRASAERANAQRAVAERAQSEKADAARSQRASAERAKAERATVDRPTAPPEERTNRKAQTEERAERNRSTAEANAAEKAQKTAEARENQAERREAAEARASAQANEKERGPTARDRAERPDRPERTERADRPERPEVAEKPADRANPTPAERSAQRTERANGRADLTARANELAARKRAAAADAARAGGESTTADPAGKRGAGRADLLADRSKEGRAERERERREAQQRIAKVRAERQTRKLNPVEVRERKQARAELRQTVRSERKREVAQYQERNRERIERIRDNRRERVATLQARRSDLRNLVVANQRADIREERLEQRMENFTVARREIRDYWHDRGDVVRYHAADRRDHLFHDEWWEDCDWRRRPVYVSSPWWWWRPAEWSSVNVFLDFGWSDPLVYDYGTDVIYDDTAVYVHGEPWGTPVEYSRHVIQVANPVEVVAEAPVVESDWTPLGVWALVQENQEENAVMFFQLSVDKAGLISGAYTNVVTGERLPLYGQVERETQRAAWHVGKNKEKVFEAGIANLTENEASCLVHVAPGEMQPWLLVRMQSPELPTVPESLSDTTAPLPTAAAN